MKSITSTMTLALISILINLILVSYIVNNPRQKTFSDYVHTAHWNTYEYSIILAEEGKLGRMKDDYGKAKMIEFDLWYDLKGNPSVRNFEVNKYESGTYELQADTFDKDGWTFARFHTSDIDSIRFLANKRWNPNFLTEASPQ